MGGAWITQVQRRPEQHQPQRLTMPATSARAAAGAASEQQARRCSTLSMQPDRRRPHAVQLQPAVMRSRCSRSDTSGTHGSQRRAVGVWLLPVQHVWTSDGLPSRHQRPVAAPLCSHLTTASSCRSAVGAGSDEAGVQQLQPRQHRAAGAAAAARHPSALRLRLRSLALALPLHACGVAGPVQARSNFSHMPRRPHSGDRRGVEAKTSDSSQRRSLDHTWQRETRRAVTSRDVVE